MKCTTLTILTILFIFTIQSNPIYSQCKLEVDKFDEFTGEKVIITDTERIWGLPKEGAFEVVFSAIDSNFFMAVKIPVSGVTHSGNNEKTVLLYDDQKILINNVNSKVSDYENLSKYTFWSQQLLFKLSEEDMLKIADERLLAVRFYISDRYKEYHIKKEKNAIKFSDLARCALRN